jgi:hypothetical protein
VSCPVARRSEVRAWRNQTETCPRLPSSCLQTSTKAAKARAQGDGNEGVEREEIVVKTGSLVFYCSSRMRIGFRHSTRCGGNQPRYVTAEPDTTIAVSFAFLWTGAQLTRLSWDGTLLETWVRDYAAFGRELVVGRPRGSTKAPKSRHQMEGKRSRWWRRYLFCGRSPKAGRSVNRLR